MRNGRAGHLPADSKQRRPTPACAEETSLRSASQLKPGTLGGRAMMRTPHADGPWYKDLGVVSIGCQSGGPDDGGIGTIKVELWRFLKAECSSTHCPAVDHYAIVLRVGGSFAEWSPAKIHRIRRDRVNRSIGCDINIPVAEWLGRTPSELRCGLVERVEAAIQAMTQRLQVDGEDLDLTSLMREVRAATSRFREAKPITDAR